MNHEDQKQDEAAEHNNTQEDTAFNATTLPATPEATPPLNKASRNRQNTYPASFIKIYRTHYFIHGDHEHLRYCGRGVCFAVY